MDVTVPCCVIITASTGIAAISCCSVFPAVSSTSFGMVSSLPVSVTSVIISLQCDNIVLIIKGGLHVTFV